MCSEQNDAEVCQNHANLFRHFEDIAVVASVFWTTVYI